MTHLTGPMVAELSTWMSIVTKLFGTRMNVLLEPHGLTQGQFSILHHIARQPRQGGSRVSEIAAAVEVEQPAVTKTLTKFQNMGLVEITADTKDKRARSVVGTPAADRMLGKIYADIGPDLAKVFASVEPSELEGLARNLRQLGEWMDKNRLSRS